MVTSTLLVRVTIGYLALPLVVFFAGWLRVPWSWVAAAGVVATGWWAARRLAPDRLTAAPARDPMPAALATAGPRRLRPELSAGHLLTLVLGGALLTVVVSLNGAGGVGVQVWDWEKHNALLADLVQQAWPVAYASGDDSEAIALVYYVAYYLVPAAVGRGFGWAAAQATLWAGTVAGVVLTWQWLSRLAGGAPRAALAVVALFSGHDLLGRLVAPSESMAGTPWWQQFDLEWWHGAFVYPGNVTAIAYAPHQALGAWLTSALVFEALRRGVRGFPLVWPLAVGLLWSPFAMLGLAALLGLFVVTGGVGGLRWRRWRGQLSTAAVVTVAALVLPLALYFASRLPAPELPLDLQPPAHAHDVARLRFVPAVLGPAKFAWEWLRFVGIELGAWVAALGVMLLAARRRTPGVARFDGRLLAAAVVVLGLVPFLAYGYYNDWAMRASLPALFALQVLAVRGLTRASAGWRARALLLAVLLSAGLYPLAQLVSRGAIVLDRRTLAQVMPLSRVDDVFTLQRTGYSYFGFAAQYVGRSDATFFRYLAGPLVARPLGAPGGGPQPQGPEVPPSRGETRSN